MRFLNLYIVTQINELVINTFGGDYNPPDNIINRGTIEWVLERIENPLFGEDQYPTIFEKAALLLWYINTGHVFFDGNKRTAFVVAATFLKINGYNLVTSQDTVKEISLKVATYQQVNYSFEELVQWITENTTKID